MTPFHSDRPTFLERRAKRRGACALDATIRMRGRFAVAGRTADLTTVGARIDDAGPFPPGSEIWLRLPGLESQTGCVVWSRPGATGVRFDRPLHPAVFARFLPEGTRLVVVESAPPASLPAEIATLPRREQILQGFGAVEPGPLRRIKKPLGGGFSPMIRRNVVRHADHRVEERYADALRTGPMRLKIGEQNAEVRDVSTSGLRVAASDAAGVGTQVAVRFKGYPEMRGRVVWRRAGEIGISLPPGSLALDDA